MQHIQGNHLQLTCFLSVWVLLNDKKNLHFGSFIWIYVCLFFEAVCVCRVCVFGKRLLIIFTWHQ